MEGHAAPGAHVRDGDRDRDLVPARPARLDLRLALRPCLVRCEPAARGAVALLARSRPHRGRVRRRGRGAGLMAIGVKVMKRPGAEASYLRATLKGMALTFSHLWRP